MSPLRRGLLLATISSVIFGVMGIALLLEGDSATARSTFAVAVIVAATSGDSVIHRVERWKLSAQSTIHFTIMLCTVLPALWLVMFVVFGVIPPKHRARAGH